MMPLKATSFLCHNIHTYTHIIVLNSIHIWTWIAFIVCKECERGTDRHRDQVKGIRGIQFVLQVWPQIKLNHLCVCDTHKDQLKERERKIETTTTATAALTVAVWNGISVYEPKTLVKCHNAVASENKDKRQRRIEWAESDENVRQKGRNTLNTERKRTNVRINCLNVWLWSGVWHTNVNGAIQNHKNLIKTTLHQPNINK